jgi:CHAD domain-containing protein
LTADTHTWLAARSYLLDRCDDFYLQLTRAREAFGLEEIHDLRVSSRRLREGIAVFVHCFRKRLFSPVRAELKSLTAMLGAIRNTDEAILFFSSLAEQCDPGTASSVMDAVAKLQERRAEEQRNLKKELKKVDPGSLLARIDGAYNNPLLFDPSAQGLFQPVAECLMEAIAARERTMVDLIADALHEENVTAQHRLRIAVKRFRYRVEFLAPLVSGEYKKIYAAIKEYQEILGHLHDLDVFSSLTGEIITGPAGILIVENMIRDKRRSLFGKFLQLHATDPLDEMGDRVRGLL